MLIVTAVNLSGLARISDYAVEIRINQHRLASGLIHRHRRSAGYRALLRKIAASNNLKEA